MPIIEGEANIVNKLFNSLEGHKTLANIPVLTFPPSPRFETLSLRSIYVHNLGLLGKGIALKLIYSCR